MILMPIGSLFVLLRVSTELLRATRRWVQIYSPFTMRSIINQFSYEPSKLQNPKKPRKSGLFA